MHTDSPLMSSSPTQNTELIRDRVFDILADPIRRALLDGLRRAETITLETLAHDLVANDEVPDEDLERLKTKLYHIQLPKLAAAGLIDFDHSAGTIRPNGTLESAWQC